MPIPRRSAAGRLVALVCASAVVTVAASACTTSSKTDEDSPTSVPTSAVVTAPAGAAARTPVGTTLNFGQSAVLPANAFAAGGALAMFTVTGITRAEGVPESTTKGGTAYFVYATVTSLAVHPETAPTLVGFAGSADGKTPALTLSPTPGLAKCPTTAPPAQMQRGESYSTCLVSVTDKGTKLRQVIYWADTTGDEGLDYKAEPVRWATPAPVAAGTSSPAPQ